MLWGHGTAWMPKNIDNFITTRAFSTGGIKEMNIKELKNSLPKDIVFDFILFDACYMSSIEVIYELKNHTKYIIASPVEILGEGFPYNQVVKYMLGSGEANLKKLCQTFYNYYNQKEGLLRSAYISLFKTAALDDIATLIKGIIKNAPDTDLDLLEVQPLDHLYKGKSILYDLGDYISHISSPKPTSSSKRNSMQELSILRVHLTRIMNFLKRVFR